MKFPIAIFICFFTFFQSSPLGGQSLIQDTERMIRALNDLEKATQDRSEVLMDNSLPQVMAILQNYDQSTLTDTLTTNSWTDLLDNYEDNTQITRVLREKGFALPDTLSSEFYSSYHQWKKAVQTGTRQKMISLLHAEEAVSPAQYLSVPNTLEKYRLPPVKNVESARLAAQNSNSNISGGIFNATAVIQGLFEFVLSRAKDEVVVNYLEKMLQDDGRKFGKLFPTVVAQFSDRSFNYSNSFIRRLRQAFYEDIQLMSVNLPALLLEDDYFRPLQSEPVAYNFLAIYSMVGMSMNDVPVEEILPITHRFLYQSYEEAIKEVNFELADTAYGTPEYTLLIELSGIILRQLKSLYRELDDSERELRRWVNELKNTHREILEENPDWRPPDPNKYLRKSAYDFEVLLGSDKSLNFDLGLLPSLLKGQLDSAEIMGYNTLRSYDKFFGKDRSERQWRAAGLEIAQKLNGTWYRKENMTNILYAWQKDLAAYRFELDKWENLIDPEGALQIALEKMSIHQQRLISAIRNSKIFWKNSLSYNQGLAFDLLAVIAESVQEIDDDPDFEDLPEVERLEIKLDTLLAIEERLIVLDRSQRAINPDNFRASPVDTFLAGKDLTVTPYAYIIAGIDELNTNLYKLDQQINLLEKKFAPLSSRARDNAKPVLQTTEFATQLMYGLSSGIPDQKWITRVELDSMMDGGLRQNIFMGLMTQRLSKSMEIPLLSSAGVSRLMELTVNDLPGLPKHGSLDTLVKKDSTAFYNRASFVVNTLNRMLELPLVVSKSNKGEFTPLKDQFPGMAKVPDIANQTLDFVYYINLKDHRHAVSTLLRLFSFLDGDIEKKQEDLKQLNLTESDKGQNTRKSAIDYLQTYGDFIADLIDAEEGQQIEDLLTNISGKPGTSRIKRTEKLTISLNAYLGGNIGWEKWTGNNNTLTDDGSISLAPSIPIGISISHLFGKKKQSFTLFFSFMDLGSLLTYRTNVDISGEPVLSFRNVFKPGLQLHYNIPKSPFYLALGGQYGPQVLEDAADSTFTLNSTRFFFGFGVDVPIRTFFQK